MRIDILDGFRGWFLICMTMGHLALLLASGIGRRLNHQFGFPDVAQGFVLLSGLIIGIVYGRRLLTRSETSMRQSLFGRIRIIYRWHALLLIAIFACTLLWADGLVHFLWGDLPTLSLALGLALLSGPMFINILPMYILFMALTPMALQALRDGHERTLILLSVSAWLVVQFGLVDWVQSAIVAWTGLDDKRIEIGLYLDRLAWQPLYFGGLIAGMRVAQNRLDLSFVRTGAGAVLFAASLMVAGIILALTILRNEGHLAREGALMFDRLFERRTLSILSLLEFLAAAYIAVWLLVAGDRSGSMLVRRIASVFRAVVGWRPMIFLGRHSLSVYTWHVALCYVVMLGGWPWIRDTPILLREILCVALTATLFLAGWLNARSASGRAGGDKGAQLRTQPN
ncbi:MAG: hypothetical protein CMH12_11060 [Maritimibacter sp.]|nr:hypothetical protein [Maritimibacter sp.]